MICYLITFQVKIYFAWSQQINILNGNNINLELAMRNVMKVSKFANVKLYPTTTIAW